MTPRQGLLAKPHLYLIIPGLVLAGLVALLISRNYLSQVELQEFALRNLQHGLEKHAAAVSYFYAERENDLKNLAEDREISIFFENQALGMSMEYGLRASLTGIQKVFDRLVAERKLNQDRIYDGFIFLNKTGECLAASPAPDASRIPPGTWKRFLAPEGSGPVILVEPLKETVQVLISAPYFFKGAYAGQIIALVNLEAVQKHLVSGVKSNSVYTLTYLGNLLMSCGSSGSKAPAFLPDPESAKIGGYQRLQAFDKNDSLTDMVAVWTPIPQTPFYLLGLWPSSRVFGHISPSYLLIALGSLSLLSLGGLGVVWRGATRNLVLNARLEEASRREQEIAEKNLQLHREKDAAEAASRAKSQFLANMSHEIRTPMNGVLGMTELLLNTELTEKQRRFVGTVRSSAETLLNILKDILDFSKIEAGKLELENIPFDLPLTLEEVAELLAEGAQNKGLEFVCAVAPEVPRLVQGDPNRLRQILMNLLSNAIKFTDAGEVVTRAELVQDQGEAVVVRVEVQDSGIGIDPEAQDQIFEDFRQADGSTTRNFGGTGLGLAIAKRLVDMMGGDGIGLRSQPGQGSTFWFTVRLQKLKDPTPDEADPGFCLRDVRVLIVDDNATNRLILHHQITAWSMVDDAAADGVQALEMLHAAARRGEPYHLAILDLNMPGMNGLELARAIKADPGISEVRLIMLTSMGACASAQEAREAGIIAYLTKPVRQSHLLNCLVALMRNTAPGPPQVVPAASCIKFPGKVLLAEDNLVNQEVTRAMLEGCGCQVESAFNGTEVLAAMGRTRYDIILMDCQMPQLDGYETTRIIRKQEAAGDQPRNVIIAVTAHAMEGDRETCLAAGMDDYLGKPFTQEELQHTLARWLPLRVDPKPVALQGQNGAPKTLASPLDRKVLAQIINLQTEGAPDLLSRVIQAYLKEAPGLLAKLKEAIQQHDPEVVHRTAHSLKSSSANVGALNLSALFKELEVMGRSRSLDHAGQFLDHAVTEYDRVKQALRQEFQKRAS